MTSASSGIAGSKAGAHCAGESQVSISCSDELAQAVITLLRPWRAEVQRLGMSPDTVIQSAVDLAIGDLLTFARRDPATHGSWKYVLEAYGCFHAVLAYRVAHVVHTAAGEPWQRWSVARKISERAKVRTGVEIHPGATVGPRFVIDHGIGTVIGEDVTIGSDGYLLQGVVLGALGIADNATGRRHPRLGDRVQVGGFARVLGPISVGDDVIIGSHALVRADVPSEARVVVMHQYQMVTGPQPVVIYGVESLGGYRYRLHGIDLDRSDIEVHLLDPAQLPLPPEDWSVQQVKPHHITVRISPKAGGLRSITHIRVRHHGSEVIVGIPTTRSTRSRSLTRPLRPDPAATDVGDYN